MISRADASLHDEEGRAFLQDRLGFFGTLGAACFAALAAGRALVLLSQDGPWLAADNAAFVAAAAALASVWVACRWASHSPSPHAATPHAGVAT